jgi:hypothetical protein
LLLLISLDLGAAMAVQQMLMILAVITLMWRFINLRAELKQLKNRQSRSERSKSSYNARLEDEYADSPRERQRGRKRRNDSYDDDERRLLRQSQEYAVDPMLFRPRGRSIADADGRPFESEDPDMGYGSRRNNDEIDRCSSDWDDDSDWDRQPPPRKPRRVLLAADTMTATRTLEDESFGRSDFDVSQGTPRQRTDLDNEFSPRRRRNRSVGEASAVPNRPRRDFDGSPERSSNDSRNNGAEDSMARYVDYEAVVCEASASPNPLSGLPPSGSEPIVFPDCY